jgi:hypothetical protein
VSELRNIGPGMYVADGDLHLDTPELARHLGIPVDALTDDVVERAVRGAFDELEPGRHVELEFRDDAGSWRQ